MKKIFTFLIAVASISVASAQPGKKDHSFDDNKGNYGNKYDHRDKKYNAKDYRWGNDRKEYYDERGRRKQVDRINRDYDRRINAFRNDRRMNKFERERRIRALNAERNQQLKSFGAGAAVGAVAGLILGSILSR